VALGAAYYATATRFYQSGAALLVLQTGGDVLATSLGESSNSRMLSTYCELMRSTAVLGKTIDRLPPEYRADFVGSSREKQAGQLAANLTARTLRDTNIIEVQYRSEDPYAAQVVVAAVLEAYFEFVDETHKGSTGAVMDMLTREKSQLEEKLTRTEADLLVALQRVGDLGLGASGHTSHPAIERARALNAALIDAQKRRLEQQAILASVEAGVRNGDALMQHLAVAQSAISREVVSAALGLDSSSQRVLSDLESRVVAGRTELQALGRYFGPAHPRITSLTQRLRIDEELLNARRLEADRRLNERLADGTVAPLLLRSLQRMAAEAAQREETLAASFDQAQSEAVHLNGDLARLEMLEHDMQRLRSFHDVLLEQIANIDLKQESVDFRANVIREPLANLSPVSPKARMVAMVFLAAGFLIGCVIVYAIDILDDRFRSPEELQSQLGVPVLAMVRFMDGEQQPGFANLLTRVAPDDAAAEAFRTLRTALAFHAERSERLLLTSSEPGDGKTTVMANLAVSIAQSGKKTLLMDIDLRRPGMTALLEMKGLPGMGDLLSTNGDLAELAAQVTRTTEIPNLDVIPSGRRRPNPGELIVGPNLAELLAWAETRYDQILIDSPPVLAASDAQLIGRLVDGAVLVVDAKKNPRRAVLRAIEGLRMMNVDVVGTIVNRVRPEDGAGYGYGYGYAYDYGQSSEDDDEADAQTGQGEPIPAWSGSGDEPTAEDGGPDDTGSNDEARRSAA
jgi:succinoglycan biosynthesis transport protein ExoP